MTNILSIDDDVELCSLLADYLHAEGFNCEYAHNGDDGLRMLEAGGFDLVILDVMLPGRDGLDVLRGIRTNSDIPVIMLTAKTDHIDRVVGLEIGADDYICKPFNPRELLSRIRAVLRRSYDAERKPDNRTDCEFLIADDLEMDTRSRTVSLGGRGIILTNSEFNLLKILLLNIGNVVSLEKLSAKVLNREYRSDDRSLSVYISNLRRKIGPYPAGNERIVTVRGKGFLYVYAKQPHSKGL